MPFSVFAAGVLVGAFTALPGGQSNASSPVTQSAAPESAVTRPIAGVSRDRGADPVGSARATLPVALGTALVDPPPSPVTASAAPPASAQVTPRPPGHRGTLIVTSQPRGASVFVNNRLAGRTPLVMNALPAGSRAVRLSLDGYAGWSRGVSVVANQSTTVTARLETIR